MKIGMLWYDNSKDDLVIKVDRAAEYYAEKYGKTPNVCFCHPAMVPQDAQASIELRLTPTIIEHHYWIGVEDEPC